MGSFHLAEVEDLVGHLWTDAEVGLLAAPLTRDGFAMPLDLHLLLDDGTIEQSLLLLVDLFQLRQLRGLMHDVEVLLDVLLVSLVSSIDLILETLTSRLHVGSIRH